MCLPVPQIEEISEYNSATTIFLKTTFFPKKQTWHTFSGWGPTSLSCKGAVPLHNLRGSDPNPRLKFTNLTTIMEEEISIT